MATNLPPVGINTFVQNATTSLDSISKSLANLKQTGFSGQNSFATAQADFKALGSPDAAGSGLEKLTQIVGALVEVVKALGEVVAALKGGEAAQAKPAEGGAGQIAKGEEKPAGGEAAKTEEKPAGGEAAKTDQKPAAGGTGGTENAQAAGGPSSGVADMLRQLAPLISSLMEVLKALTGQTDEEAKAAEAAGGKGGKEAAKGKGGEKAAKGEKAGKGGGTHASENAKEHAAPNSKVGQQAMMEKLNQAVVQILTALVEMLAPMIQQLAGQMKDNPQAAGALQSMTDVLNKAGGGGVSGGVLNR